MQDRMANVLIGAYVLIERMVEWATGLLDRQVSAKIIPVMVIMTGVVLALGTLRSGC